VVTSLTFAIAADVSLDRVFLVTFQMSHKKPVLPIDITRSMAAPRRIKYVSTTPCLKSSLHHRLYTEAVR